MKKLTPRKLAILGSLTIISGLLIMMVSLLGMPSPTSAETSNATTPGVTIPDPKPVAQVTSVASPVEGRPARVTLVDLKIDLPVIDGDYNKKNGQWTLTKNKAQFATPSKLANNTSGTTFIYGHDTRAVFSRLHSIKPGAEAMVTTDNGYRFIYTFHDSIITDPLAINEVTAESATPRLSLLTCYGPTSADRQIFHFYLSRVEKV